MDKRLLSWRGIGRLTLDTTFRFHLQFLRMAPERVIQSALLLFLVFSLILSLEHKTARVVGGRERHGRGHFSIL